MRICTASTTEPLGVIDTPVNDRHWFVVTLTVFWLSEINPTVESH
jgi:hypothetical protein